jgi:hypothetical protein
LIERGYIAENPSHPGSYLNVAAFATLKPRGARDIPVPQYALILYGLILGSILTRKKQKQVCGKQGGPAKCHAPPLNEKTAVGSQDKHNVRFRVRQSENKTLNTLRRK